MIVRDFLPTDLPALKALHAAQGIDYAFPDIDNPLFFIRKVLVVDDRVVGAVMLKLCAETMLLLDKQQEPQEKLTEIETLQSSVLSEAFTKGLDEIHASVPPIGFDKRLTQLGWSKDRPGWELWSRSTHAERGR